MATELTIPLTVDQMAALNRMLDSILGVDVPPAARKRWAEQQAKRLLREHVVNEYRTVQDLLIADDWMPEPSDVPTFVDGAVAARELAEAQRQNDLIAIDQAVEQAKLDESAAIAEEMTTSGIPLTREEGQARIDAAGEAKRAELTQL